MAVDKKSDYVGNHGGKYVDIDGMTKQFTYIDHDKHTTRLKLGRESKEEKQAKEERIEQLKGSIKSDTEKAIERILAMPAVNAVRNPWGIYEEFVIRDTESGVIIWNETVVKNALTINDILRYNLWIQVWKRTVKEQYWFEDMSHEDILAGKWEAWM